MRLLVVEDEQSLREGIAKKLRLSGYEVDACEDGEEALDILASEQYDLILLDLNLPKVDGMTVLRTLRQSDLETRVLILSARSEIADKVDGLDAGANDYLSKPFHLAELEARVRSLTRRQFIQRDICLRCGRLSFDTKSRVASVDAEGMRRAGISAPASGTADQSGGIDGARLGWECRLLQQFHPRAHFRPAEKAESGAGLRSHLQSHRRRI